MLHNMARVTVELCLSNKNISDRFELVLLACFRAKSLESGESVTLEVNDNSYKKGSCKTPILALQEIEHSTIDVDQLKSSMNSVVSGKKEHVSISSTKKNNSVFEVQDDDDFYIS